MTEEQSQSGDKRGELGKVRGEQKIMMDMKQEEKKRKIKGGKGKRYNPWEETRGDVKCKGDTSEMNMKRWKGTQKVGKRKHRRQKEEVEKRKQDAVDTGRMER